MFRRASPELGPALARAIAREADARGGMSPELPGRVYERARAADRRARRAGAVYYTPPHLVDFAIDRALGPLLAEAGGDPMALRVLDPACGGGAFLLAALEYLAAAGGDRLAILRGGLRGIDVDPQAAAVARLALGVAVPQASRADLARAVAVADALEPASAPAGGFDAVVTNPPWGQKRFALGVEKRRRYRALYASARGAIDPFALFVERGLALLRPGGRWGMVLPDVVLLKNHEPLRALVLAGSELEWIAHAGRAFEAVNLDAVVMVGRRAAPASGHRVAIWHSLPAGWRERPPATRRQAQALFARLPGKRFNLHLAAGDVALVDRLAAHPPIGTRYEIHEGVHSGNARGKLFVAARPAGPGSPIVVGRGEVARYRISWAGAWLDRAPGALDRAAGDYANLGRPEWHLRPKVVVRRTGDHLVAAWDDQGLYVSNNLFVVLPRSPGIAAAEQRALVAVLNSALMTWCFRAQVPRVGRLFAELKIQHLAALPLPPFSAASLRRLDRLARRRAAARDPAPIDRAIDDEVAALFDLSAADRRRVGG